MLCLSLILRPQFSKIPSGNLLKYGDLNSYILNYSKVWQYKFLSKCYYSFLASWVGNFLSTFSRYILCDSFLVWRLWIRNFQSGYKLGHQYETLLHNFEVNVSSNIGIYNTTFFITITQIMSCLVMFTENFATNWVSLIIYGFKSSPKKFYWCWNNFAYWTFNEMQKKIQNQVTQ